MTQALRAPFSVWAYSVHFPFGAVLIEFPFGRVMFERAIPFCLQGLPEATPSFSMRNPNTGVFRWRPGKLQTTQFLNVECVCVCACNGLFVITVHERICGAEFLKRLFCEL